MRLEILLEESSAEVALSILLPRLMPGHSYRFRTAEGWQDLMKKLPGLLAAYATRILRQGETDLRVLVLMDADAKCRERKAQLEAKALAAGLSTKSSTAGGAAFHVLNRVAVDELEAWLLGDRPAIQAAYPRIHPPHFKGMDRDPDAGLKSSVALHNLLKKGGYFLSGKQKRRWAADIAPHMNVQQNESASFCCFREGLAALR